MITSDGRLWFIDPQRIKAINTSRHHGSTDASSTLFEFGLATVLLQQWMQLWSTGLLANASQCHVIEAFRKSLQSYSCDNNETKPRLDLRALLQPDTGSLLCSAWSPSQPLLWLHSHASLLKFPASCGTLLAEVKRCSKATNVTRGRSTTCLVGTQMIGREFNTMGTAADAVPSTNPPLPPICRDSESVIVNDDNAPMCLHEPVRVFMKSRVMKLLPGLR